MSRTVRKSLREKSWAKKFHDGKIQKFGLHRSCMHHKRTGKMALGPGGIACNCCIHGVAMNKIKTVFTRWERHTAEIPDYDVEIPDYDGEEDFQEETIDNPESL